MIEKLKLLLGVEKDSSTDQAINGIQAKFSGMKASLGKSVGMMSSGAITLGASAAGLGVMISQVADVDRMFENLAMETGTASDQMSGLRDTVYDLNAELGKKSVTETAELMGSVARTSKATGAELKQLTYQTGLLGQRFGDQEGALRAQVELMRTFGQSVTESGDAVSYLLSQGGDMKGELLESVAEYAVQFKEAGFSLEQTIGMLQAGLGKSWNVDQAADSLKEARVRLFGGDKTTVDAMNLLGLGDMNSQLAAGTVGMDDVFSSISAGMKGLNKVEQFRIGTAIFGTKWEDVGADAMLGMLSGMNSEVKTTGTLASISNSFKNRFSYKWDRAVSESMNAWTEMLESMKPALLPIVEGFGNAAKSVRDFAQEYGYISKTLGVGVVGFLSLGLVLGGLKIVLGGVTAMFALLSGPIGLAVGGITGFVLLMNSLVDFDRVGRDMAEDWEEIKVAFRGAKEDLKGLWEWIQKIPEELEKMGDKFLNWASAIPQKLTEMMDKLTFGMFSKVTGGFGDGVDKLKEKADEITGGKFSVAVDAVGKLPSQAVGWVGDNLADQPVMDPQLRARSAYEIRKKNNPNAKIFSDKTPRPSRANWNPGNTIINVGTVNSRDRNAGDTLKKLARQGG